MDTITQCYYSRMRPYRDRPDISVPGRWRWCPPGAKVIPYLHKFGSFTSDWGEERIDPPVGEIPRKNGRSRGEANPRYTGQGWCGTAQEWMEGSLYAGRIPPAVDEDGIPLCCPAGAAIGGLVLGGNADQGMDDGGGVELGGAADAAFTLVYHADAGVELGGISSVFSHQTHTEGGAQFGGRAGRFIVIVGDALQGVEFGGDASKPLEYFEFQGFLSGLEFGGTASEAATFRYHGLGGVEVDGEGGHSPIFAYVPHGGVELGGTASQPATWEWTPEGGVELGGSAAVALVYDYHAEGGVEVGGASPLASGSILTACCSNPLPSTMYAIVEWSTPPSDAPVTIPLVYDPVEDAWLGGAPLGPEGCFTTFRWACTGTSDEGMHLTIAVPSEGLSIEGPPPFGEAHCEALSWLYQQGFAFPVCGWDLTNTFRVTIVRTLP